MSYDHYSQGTEPEILDSLVIGGGPIGLACGIALSKKNLEYRILEKGCLVNSLYHYPSNMTFFSTSEKLEIGDVPFISINPKANRQEALEYYRRVTTSLGLRIHVYEEVLESVREEHFFRVKSSKAEYLTRSIIIATGFFDFPNLMKVPGEDLPKVHHYFHEAHPYFGQKVLVVGSANSAVDVALETWRKGSEVTMVIKQAQFEDNVKYWAKPDIENRIKEGSIKAYFQSEIVEIKPQSVIIQSPEGILEIPNDFVFAMTGYLPNFSLLKKLGIHLQEDQSLTPIYNPDTMESNQENIYLAGVVCGGLNTRKWFIENSRVHADMIAEDLIRKIQPSFAT
jgi:putative YpdA family bacillithiol system oxidoreductase